MINIDTVSSEMDKKDLVSIKEELIKSREKKGYMGSFILTLKAKL
jgi:hypothetical protein